MNKRTLFWIVVGLLVAAILVSGIFFLINRSSKNPLKTKISINKDTSQTIITDPNQHSESYNSSQFLTVLGEDKLVNAGMTQAQLNELNSLLKYYVNQQLKGVYNQVSLLNTGFTSTGNIANGQMRLGTTNTLLNFNVLYQNLNEVELKISSPTGNQNFNYDSGLQTAQSTTQYGNDQSQ